MLIIVGEVNKDRKSKFNQWTWVIPGILPLLDEVTPFRQDNNEISYNTTTISANKRLSLISKLIEQVMWKSEERWWDTIMNSPSLHGQDVKFFKTFIVTETYKIHANPTYKGNGQKEPTSRFDYVYIDGGGRYGDTLKGCWLAQVITFFTCEAGSFAYIRYCEEVKKK